MATDPRHGRRIPSGTRLARGLARIFRAAWPDAESLMRVGGVSGLGRMREQIAKLALDALGVEIVRGYLQTWRRAKRGHGDRSIPRIRNRGLLCSHHGLSQKAVGDIPPTVPTIAVGGSVGSPGFRVDWSIFRPEVRVAAENAALRLAGTIIEDTRRMIREELSSGLQAGEPVAAIAERVRLQGFSPRRAHVIAQTEASRAMHAGQGVAARELGVTEWTWLASSDACEICLPLDGKTVAIGVPFYIHPKGNPAYRVVNHPPAHPNCVLGETPVWGVSLSGAVSAEYQGPILRLKFSDGSRIAVTPNHMLLTPSGFARATDLVEGDNVLCTGLRKAESFPNFHDPDVNWKPPTAEQVFRSLAESGCVPPGGVPVSPEYLHGDARFCQGEINVIRPDRVLWDRHDSSLHKPAGHLSFVAGSRYAGGGGFGSCYLRAMLDSLLHATDRLVGRRRELQALFWSEPAVSYGLGFRTGTNGQSESFQSVNYYPSAYLENIRHAQDTIPGLVTTAQLLEIKRDSGGHKVLVYDFETVETMYLLGNGIIGSNCMCTVTEEFPE